MAGDCVRPGALSTELPTHIERVQVVTRPIDEPVDAPFTWIMSFEQLAEIWAGPDSRPRFLRRPLVAVALTWLVIALTLLVIVPASRSDAWAVARAVGIAFVAATWWWAWFEICNLVQRWLLRHPKFGEFRRMAIFLAAFAFYPLASFLVLTAW